VRALKSGGFGAPLLLAAALALVLGCYAARWSTRAGAGIEPRTPIEPLKLEWRVAVVSEDESFIETVRQAVSPKELKVLPAPRAREAAACDLVIVGWDALPKLSRSAGLVLSLVNSSRVLAVAEPGEDALSILLSGVVEPVKLGERKVPKDPFALLPMVERGGYLVPGCGCSVVLVDAKRAPGGKLIAGYVAASTPPWSGLRGTLLAVLSKALEARPEESARARSSELRKAPLFRSSPAWVYLGYYASAEYSFSGSYGTAGYTGFEIHAGWGSHTYDPSRGTYLWLVTLKYHREETVNGYSPPWYARWSTVQPNAATLDSLTNEWPRQRIGDINPLGWSGDRKSSLFSQPQIVWASDYSVCYSSFYRDYVRCKATWRWGLSKFDGSGTRAYGVAGTVEVESRDPLIFAVGIRANAYLVTPRGVLDAASSGEITVYFRATTTTLEAVGSL